MDKAQAETILETADGNLALALTMGLSNADLTAAQSVLSLYGGAVRPAVRHLLERGDLCKA